MIILICINRGFPEPLVEADDERTYFSVTLYIHPDFGKRQSGDMINLKLNEKRIIKMGPHSRNTMLCAARMGVSLSVFSLTHRGLRLKGRNAPISLPNCANYLFDRIRRDEAG